MIGWLYMARWFAAAMVLWYLLYMVYVYITDPRKELARRDTIVNTKTIETKYIVERIGKSKETAERKIDEVTIINDFNVTSWVW